MSTSIDNFTVSEVNWQISTGEEIPNTVLTLTPNAGYFLDANNFSATTSSPVSNIYFTQSGDNVSMTVEFDSTPVVGDLAIPICMQGRSDLIVFTLQVDYNYSVSNASASLSPVTINREGIYGSVSNVFTNATFTADTDYYFLNTPTCVVSVGDPDNYTISNTKTYDTNSNLIGISFTAQYTFPSVNVSGDLISINASAVALPTQAPVKIRSYSFLNSEFSSDGETRRFSVFGTQGANWTLTVNNGATPSTYSSVVPSGGQDFLDINIPVGFGVDYTFTLTGDLINPFPQENPFTVSQAGDIPVLQTTEVTEVTETSAVSGGYNILQNNNPLIQKGVEWSQAIDFDTIDGFTDDGSSTDDFVSNITNLSNGTDYYVRAYATNSVGTGYGDVILFQTTMPIIPTISTASISSISWDSATSGGENISDNGSPITAKGVEWSKSSSFAPIEGVTIDGSGVGNFVSNITELSETTTYYVRAYATNTGGTGYGQTETFQTTALPITGLSWTTTVDNPCNSAPWTITNNNTRIRYDIANSENCGGSCEDTQSGTATATITVGASDVDMGLDFEGIGELEAANFEKIEFELDSVQVARAQAAGGGQKCAMGDVVKTFVTPPPYRLNANTSYTFFINFTTNDDKYHNGAYYEVDLSFTNVP